MDKPLGRAERIFLVEDDPHVLNALRFAFETEGYDVTAWSSGEELLNAAPPDGDACIVIDQRLAGLSGLETVARLRLRGVDSPAILVTTNPSPDLMRRAAGAGVEIVEKPLLTDLLARKIRAAFKGRKG